MNIDPKEDSVPPGRTGAPAALRAERKRGKWKEERGGINHRGHRVHRGIGAGGAN